MGDSVEDLLAQIKAQYADARPDANQSDVSPSGADQTVQPVSQSPIEPSPSRPASESIDDLLAEIEGKPAPTRPQSAQSLPVAPPINWQSVTPTSVEEISGIPRPKSSTDRLLDELKAQNDERDRAEELKRQEQQRAEEQQRQEQLRQEQRRQAEQKRQKQRAVMQQAEEWLKRLDPRSGEAAWFEEFAAKYESKLEAAIDYLGLDE